MTDIVDRPTRSRMMSNIKGKDTAPEMFVRRALHCRGFRYKLHEKSLPGSPDLVFPRFKAVIQIHGCFWHHHNCHLFKWPSTRLDFWMNKIVSTAKRDRENVDQLQKLGWRVLIIWECSLKGKYRLDEGPLIEEITSWLVSDISRHEISCRQEAIIS